MKWELFGRVVGSSWIVEWGVGGIVMVYFWWQLEILPSTQSSRHFNGT